MSLVGQTCWVVGGVGVVGRGITRGLLKAGATVIVNSRSSARLSKLSERLDYPDRLVSVEGSLLPGHAAKTVNGTLGSNALDHVVAHGSVRYHEDETHSMMSGAGYNDLLRMNIACEDGITDSRAALSHLVSFHLAAAQELVPRVQWSTQGHASYTFVTGDGGGHPSQRRSSIGEINAYHVWGLAAALRRDETLQKVNCRELRVGVEINRPESDRTPRARPLSEDIGRLCAGLATNTKGMDDEGDLIHIEDEASMESLLSKYSYENHEE